MKLTDVDIFIVPGIESKKGDHWYSRWLSKLPSAHLVEPGNDDTLIELKDWAARIVAAIVAASKPAILVAHGGGITALMHALPALPNDKIAGAFLVAAHDLETMARSNRDDASAINGLDRQHGDDIGADASAGLPLDKLPFPTMLIASGNCPNCAPERAKAFAQAWGATLGEAGEVGGVNAASGHGPWPEGLMRFGAFLKTLD